MSKHTMVGKTSAMPGSGEGFTMAAFNASDVPVGTELYIGSVAAAAPELLHALKEMEKYFGKYPEFVPSDDRYFEYRAVIENARNIITKATGGE